MSMRKSARWLLITVLLIDAAFVAAFFGGRDVVFAQDAAEERSASADADADTDADADVDAGAEAGSAADALDGGAAGPGDTQNPWSARALEALGRELSARASELDRREAEVAEARRGVEVLARAGRDAPEDRAAPPPARASAEPDPGDERGDAPAAGAAFQRLQKAYENMEPTTAATALQRLAARDRDAVVQLLLGWQPRISGAILDALTQSDPELAADLSYEIWKLSGGKSGA